MNENTSAALEMLGDMMVIDPEYRDVAKLFEELQSRTH